MRLRSGAAASDDPLGMAANNAHATARSSHRATARSLHLALSIALAASVLVIAGLGSGAAVAAESAKAATACSNEKHGTKRAERLKKKRGTKRAERLNGTKGADRIKSGRGADKIGAREGADCLHGGPGGDTITGGPGADTISGGSGPDVILARDGQPDTIHCGGGRDTVQADAEDIMHGCEAGKGVEPSSGETGGGGTCSVDPATLIGAGCQVLKSDTSTAADPEPLWGNLDCETESRHQLVTGGADSHPTASGAAQGNDSYRRLSVFDGDDFWGERCELGANEHRDGDSGTFATYEEGDRRVTFLSIRPERGVVDVEAWQTVMQMKQAQPSDNGGGTPILEMQLYGGEYRLHSEAEELWDADAQPGVWSRFAYDVTYSQDPSIGRVTVYADLNGDGDAADPDEQSPTIEIATLKVESAGGDDDGVAEGESIPSHLRAGIYHNPSIGCATSCGIDVDNVQVTR